MTLDIMSNSSFCFTSKYKANWKENLVVDQTSLRAFFHALLHSLVVFFLLLRQICLKYVIFNLNCATRFSNLSKFCSKYVICDLNRATENKEEIPSIRSVNNL